jgi:hypothetical protein
MAHCTAAHAGAATVEQPQQRGLRFAAQRLRQFEVAVGGGRQVDQLAAALHVQCAYMRQRPALRVLGKGQQCGGGGMRQRQVLRVQAGQVRDAQLLAQFAYAERGVELPGRTLRQGSARSGHGGGQCVALHAQDLGRIQARQPRRQLALSALGQPEPAAREAEPGQAIAAPVAHDRQQQRVAPLREQFAIGHRARCHHARDLALDRPFGGGHVAHLLRDRHRLAELDQTRQVGLYRVRGHASHHHRLAGALAARGQRDVEQAVGLARVVVEQLVEVAHAVEHERAWVLGLDAQVLRHHWRVGREVHRVKRACGRA